MSRAKGHNKAAVKRRERLENAVAMLVSAEIAIPLVRLRVSQAIERTGLRALLSPALEDLASVENAIQRAKHLIANEAESARSDG